MKWLLTPVFLLYATVSFATTYTVKKSGGQYSTIQGCATVAVAGDTCVVYVGSYSETVTPAHSGSTGLPITFIVNIGDTVTVTGSRGG